MANSQSSSFVPSGNRIAVGDVYGHKVIVGNQNSVRPDEIYAEVDNLNHLTKVVDFGRTLVPGGGGGTTDYNELENLPQINGVELSGDLSAEDLGLQDSINVNQGGTTSSTPELSDININGTQYAISKPYINETIPQFSFTAKLNTIRIPGSNVYYTVPAISTNVTTDYNSDSKTTSPKAVKEFVEGKGYYIKPQDGIPASDLASGVIPTVPVQDVTVGGTSVVSSGTAVIPAIPDVSGKENSSNKVSTIAGNETNTTKYPNTKATYDAIHPAVETTQPADGMLPNVLYKLGTLSGTVTIAFATPTDNTIENEYKFTFTADSTAPTITWPQSVTSWIGNSLDNGAPKVEANTYYEVSVLDGRGIFNKF